MRRLFAARMAAIAILIICIVNVVVVRLCGSSPLVFVDDANGGQYAKTLTLALSNYGHMSVDVIWRSFCRDYGRRPVRLEKWMVARRPDFFRHLERRFGVEFEIMESSSRASRALFRWDALMAICGPEFDDFELASCACAGETQEHGETGEKGSAPPLRFLQFFDWFGSDDDDDEDVDHDDHDDRTDLELELELDPSDRHGAPEAPPDGRGPEEEPERRRGRGRAILYVSRRGDDRRTIDEPAEGKLLSAIRARFPTDRLTVVAAGVGAGAGAAGAWAAADAVVDLSRLSLVGQARLFARCDLLVSLHGAALANLMFLRPSSRSPSSVTTAAAGAAAAAGAKVVEIMPAHYALRYFGGFARVNGVSHERVGTARSVVEPSGGLRSIRYPRDAAIRSLAEEDIADILRAMGRAD